MSIDDIVSLSLYYFAIPFCLSLATTALIIKSYKKSNGKNNGKYRYLELKILDLEKDLKNQMEKTNLLSDIVVTRTNESNSKLNNIHSLIKIIDQNIINKNTSQYQYTPPLQPHVSSNSNHGQSQPNPIMLSHPQIEKESIDNNDNNQNSTIEYILKRLEHNSLTTREIQRIIGRTREHTSRLMKKLYDNKFVDRDMESKPFRYTVTNEGRKLLIKHSVSSNDSRPDYRKNSGNSTSGSTGIQYPVNLNSE
ncbi:MAG: helix-turn-helix transcriptional regulator [Nitrosopumilus sp.]|nr:helix-turn-helix transcriptional regulator [Nitrosopumilus sp.]